MEKSRKVSVQWFLIYFFSTHISYSAASWQHTFNCALLLCNVGTIFLCSCCCGYYIQISIFHSFVAVHGSWMWMELHVPFLYFHLLYSYFFFNVHFPKEKRKLKCLFSTIFVKKNLLTLMFQVQFTLWVWDYYVYVIVTHFYYLN